jgi:hypothetical protein
MSSNKFRAGDEVVIDLWKMASIYAIEMEMDGELSINDNDSLDEWELFRQHWGRPYLTDEVFKKRWAQGTIYKTRSFKTVVGKMYDIEVFDPFVTSITHVYEKALSKEK